MAIRKMFQFATFAVLLGAVCISQAQAQVTFRNPGRFVRPLVRVPSTPKVTEPIRMSPVTGAKSYPIRKLPQLIPNGHLRGTTPNRPLLNQGGVFGYDVQPVDANPNDGANQPAEDVGGNASGDSGDNGADPGNTPNVGGQSGSAAQPGATLRWNGAVLNTPYELQLGADGQPGATLRWKGVFSGKDYSLKLQR